jgi:6-phosphogluconolactonase (cycloisomerase 2 family)
MKFSKLSQLFLVSTMGLLVATLLTSCEIATIDYVFVTSSAGSGSGSAGQIETYDMDSGTGALRAGQPTVSSGGSSPVAMALTSDYENLYVANAGNSSIVHFTISGDGVLTQKDSITTGTTPISLAANTAGTYLYVVSGPNPSMLTAYSLSNGAIGSVVAQQPINFSSYTGLPGNAYLSSYATDTLVPTGITVLANSSTATSSVSGNAVYVSAYDQDAYNPGGVTTSTANPGWVFGFTIGSGSTLTPASSMAYSSPYKAGVKPSAIASDPTDRFVYVTDFASNDLIGYTIQSGNNLNFIINGPFKTGNEPQAVVVDPRGIYIYVANALDSTVSSYVIDLRTGTPSVVAAPANATETEPVAIGVDASLGRFVFTANYVGNSVSGFELNPNTGSLTPTQSSPFPSGVQPTAITSVPRGSHWVQAVTP